MVFIDALCCLAFLLYFYVNVVSQIQLTDDRLYVFLRARFDDCSKIYW